MGYNTRSFNSALDGSFLSQVDQGRRGSVYLSVSVPLLDFTYGITKERAQISLENAYSSPLPSPPRNPLNSIAPFYSANYPAEEPSPSRKTLRGIPIPAGRPTEFLEEQDDLLFRAPEPEREIHLDEQVDRSDPEPRQERVTPDRMTSGWPSTDCCAPRMRSRTSSLGHTFRQGSSALPGSSSSGSGPYTCALRSRSHER